MKHKVLFWSIIGISVVAGGAMLVIGASMGGFELYNEDQYSINVENHQASEYANIEKLEFDFAACDVTIQAGRDYSISGKGVVSEIVDDGRTWHIESPEKKWYTWLEPGDGGDVTITVPDEKSFEEVEIAFTAADMDIEKLSAKTVEISGGAGSATIGGLNVTEGLDLSIGAGEIEVESGQINGNSSLSCKAGELNVDLQALTGSMDASCGAGKIDLLLPGAERDYDISSSASLGSIQIDRDGFALTREGEEALAKLDLSCGMGEIEVDFQQNERDDD